MKFTLIAVVVPSLSSRLAWILMDSSLKAAALLTIALLINGMLRRRSAAVRDRIWTLAFCGVMVVPILSSIVPQWRIPIVGISLAEFPAPTIPPTDPIAPQADPHEIAQLEPHRLETAIAPVDVPQVRSEQIDDALTTAIDAPELFHEPDRPTSGVAASKITPATNVSEFLMIIWLAGVFVLMLPFMIAVVARGKLVGRNPSVTDPTARQLLDETSNRLGLKRKVKLLQGDEKTIPMTTGALWPAVMIPGNWQTWPAERLRLVMLHELAHVRRLDVLFQSVARIACALYWFNPLAWYALHRMRFDCELACDDQVIATGEPASAYAGQLIEIARIYRPIRFAGGIAMARSSKLEARIVSLLDTSRPHLPLGRKAGRLILAACGILVLILSAITVQNSTVVADEAGASPAKPIAGQQADAAQAAKADPAKGKPAAAVGVDPAKNEPDESQMISQIISLRGVSYADAGKHFLGSSRGGLCFVASSLDVQKEIGLEAAVAAKVRSLGFDYRVTQTSPAESLLQASRELNQSRNLSPEQLKEKRKSLLEKYEADAKKAYEEIYEQLIPQLKAALTDQQLARLQQIAWQAYGSHDLAVDSELAKTLGLQPQQIEKIVAINDDYRRKEYGPVRGQSFMVKFQDLARERDHKAVEILTPEQQETYTKLKGKPFNLALLSLPPAWQATESAPAQTNVAGVFRPMTIESIFKLADVPFVQQELGFSKDAVTRIDTINDEFAGAWREAGGETRPGMTRSADGKMRNFFDPVMPLSGIRGPRRQSPEERENGLAKMVQLWFATTAKFQPQLKEVLTPEQYGRLQQINWQTLGTIACLDNEVIQVLAMTQEQQDTIAAIASDYHSKLRTARLPQGRFGGGGPFAGGPGGPFGGGPENSESLKEVTQERDSKINEVLTKEQRDLFATLKGKSFQLPLGTTQPPPLLFEPGLRGGILSIIRSESVRTELGLTPDDAAKLEAIKDKFNRAWIETGGGIRIRTVVIRRAA